MRFASYAVYSYIDDDTTSLHVSFDAESRAEARQLFATIVETSPELVHPQLFAAVFDVRDDTFGWEMMAP